jgi:Raf kinase inhibitor-like YbhB/YbcL family protein
MRAVSGVGLRSITFVAAALLAGCGGGEKANAPLPDAPERISLRSPAFRDGARIPVEYTCDGADRSPPLRWSGVPADAKALALVMEDLTAEGFVHWTVLDAAPAAHGVAAGRAPSGGVETANSFGDRGYGGPCPPDDDPAHRYEFALYALRGPLGLGEDASPDDIRSKLRAAAISKGVLTGRFR